MKIFGLLFTFSYTGSFLFAGLNRVQDIESVPAMQRVQVKKSAIGTSYLVLQDIYLREMGTSYHSKILTFSCILLCVLVVRRLRLHVYCVKDLKTLLVIFCL